MLTHQTLLEHLHYDPTTGHFTWKKNMRGPARKGMRAGCWGKGARIIRFQQVNYAEHRLAWFWMTGSWPENEIDHKNREPWDNRWDNLREANSTQQKHNTTIRSDNKSGYKGVHWWRGRWKAVICVNKKIKYLGLFDDPAEAGAAYARAAAKYFGEFANA